jgi:YD repeat-containing protein
LGGDLGGTVSDGFVKTVRGVNATMAYDINGRLTGMSSALGTKTMAYNPDGTLASVTGTGSYKTKTFTYTDGKLTGVVVSA